MRHRHTRRICALGELLAGGVDDAAGAARCHVRGCGVGSAHSVPGGAHAGFSSHASGGDGGGAHLPARARAVPTRGGAPPLANTLVVLWLVCL